MSTIKTTFAFAAALLAVTGTQAFALNPQPLPPGIIAPVTDSGRTLHTNLLVGASALTFDHTLANGGRIPPGVQPCKRDIVYVCQ